MFIILYVSEVTWIIYITEFVHYFVSDWKVHTRIDDDTPSSNVEKKQTTLYEDLKKSINMTTNEPIELPDGQYTVAHSANESKDAIININKIISKTKSEIIAHHGLLGSELANLKLMCYINICSACDASEDNYVILSCNRCKKNKVNSANTKEYFAWTTSMLHCTKDWVNFIISISRVVRLYPKFKYVTMSLDKIKINFKLFQKSMAEDFTYWQIPSSI